MSNVKLPGPQPEGTDSQFNVSMKCLTFDSMNSSETQTQEIPIYSLGGPSEGPLKLSLTNQKFFRVKFLLKPNPEQPLAVEVKFVAQCADAANYGLQESNLHLQVGNQDFDIKLVGYISAPQEMANDISLSPPHPSVAREILDSMLSRIGGSHVPLRHG